jgi:hypothetical protein
MARRNRCEDTAVYQLRTTAQDCGLLPSPWTWGQSCLCGVAAPKGLRWTCYVDGKVCRGGLGRLTLTKDTVIEWKPDKGEAP